MVFLELPDILGINLGPSYLLENLSSDKNDVPNIHTLAVHGTISDFLTRLLFLSGSLPYFCTAKRCKIRLCIRF